MDADKLRELVARQLDVDPGPRSVDVDVEFLSGDTVTITMQRLTAHEQRLALSWALFGEGAGDDGEFFARTTFASLRYAVRDDDGSPAFRTYQDVVDFINAIKPEAYRDLGAALRDLAPDDGPIATEEDPEAGKAS